MWLVSFPRVEIWLAAVLHNKKVLGTLLFLPIFSASINRLIKMKN